MKTTYSISFYCRQSKVDRNGQAPVEMSICINGKRCFMNLPYRLVPSDFKRLLSSKKNNELKQYLFEIRKNFNSIQLDLLRNGIPLTVDTLKVYIQTGGIRSYTIENLFEDYFNLLKQRVGKTLTQDVYDKYKWVRDLFFEQIDKGSECTQITPAVVQEFYIKLQAKYQDSTSGGYMTKLKSVIRFGIDNGHIKINPFQNIRISKGVKEIETITYSQLQDIINHNFIPRVKKVADMFVFAAGSGLSFCDVMALTPDDFVIKDDKLCIFKDRKKTGVKFYSVLAPWAVDIYNKYNGVFPKISNQKTNQYLKEIQDSCGINVTLTYHKARHFYAMFMLNKKVPVTTVQKLMGHNNISTTMHYCRALETTIIDDVSKVI